MKWQIAVCISLSCFAGCHESAPTDLPLAPEFATPVATGIFITSARSPEILGVWGNPADRIPSSRSAGSLPSDFAFRPIFPNPSDGLTVIEFGLPVQSNVAVWIVPARAAGDPEGDFTVAWGALLPAPQRLAVAYPIPLAPRTAGFYRLTWSGRDEGGNPLPAGFYRVYVRFGDEIYFRDMLLYRSEADLPSGLRGIR